MGIKKLTGIFLEPLPDMSDKAHQRVVAIYIDGNQFLYNVIDMLKAKSVQQSPGCYTVESLLPMTNDDFWDMMRELCKMSITKDLVEPIKRFSRLRHITVCLDGLPPAGKLVQQFIRRKNATYFMSKEGNVFLTDNMILPGSKFVRMYATTVVELFKEAFPQQSLLFSLDNIPGEGEHKMLDLYRHSSYLAEKQACLVWSNDGDVPVCLLSALTHETYVRTIIHRFQKPVPPQTEGISMKEDKVYSMMDLRISLCRDHIDRLNSQLYISFFGNDFLPEIVNTIDLKMGYTAFRKASELPPPAQKILLTTPEGFFNPAAFLKYLDNFDDFSFYFSDMGYTRESYSQKELYQFMEVYPAKPPSDMKTKIDFKRFYYSNVMRAETQTLDNEKQYTDEEIHQFEMKMALNYLEVYIWYYYYINGYYVGNFEPYYKYNFPPLLNSLKKILRNPQMLDIRLKSPQRRTPRYSSTIPNWCNPYPQMLTVLQKKDLSLLSKELLSEGHPDFVALALETRLSFEELYPVDPEKNIFIKTRIFKSVSLANASPSTVATAEQRPKRSFTKVNDGTKVYPRFDLVSIMNDIAKRIGLTLSSDYIPPITVGNIEQVELTDFRNSNFTVGEDIEL